MDNGKWLFMIPAGIMFVLGLAFLFLGIYGMARRRPLIFPARLMLWYWVAMFVLLLSPQVRNLIYDRDFMMERPLMAVGMPVLLAVLWAVGMYVQWKQNTGYHIFGVTDESFRAGLANALQKLGLPYEEKLSNVRLTGLDADLQASVTGWAGGAQVRIKQAEHAHYLPKIAAAMNEYFRANPGKIPGIMAFHYISFIIVGIMSTGCGIWFMFVVNIPNRLPLPAPIP